jgi:predicted SPOUT superfamily RNA methylase MTH1
MLIMSRLLKYQEAPIYLPKTVYEKCAVTSSIGSIDPVKGNEVRGSPKMG